MQIHELITVLGIDIIDWAYTNDGDYCGPSADWDFAVAQHCPGTLLLQLATDPACPKQKSFLYYLYIYVGEYMRAQSNSLCTPPPLEPLLQQASSSTDPHIMIWLKRSHFILTQPATFDYDFWCNGGWLCSR